MATEQADLIRQMRQRQGELERKIGQFAGMSTGTTIGVDVRAAGARGDGVTDDAAAIQEAIDRARDIGTTYTGAIVYFPPGEYLVQSPLVLPRTGWTPGNVVWLVGANTRSSRIVGGSSMVSGESVIMWEDVLDRTYHQCIQNLTIKAPLVDGTYAIHYKMNNTSPAASVDYRAERLQIKMWNVLIEAHNDYNLYGCKFEGNLYACDFDTVWLDPALGSATYDTALFKFDTPYFVNITEDGAGLGYSSMRHIHAGIRRGGYAALITGRLNRVQVDTAAAGVGTTGDPVINLTNSFGVTMSNVFSEGRSDKPQYKFTDCRNLHLTNYTIGTPSDAGTGYGNGMELYNVRDSVFDQRDRAHNSPPFSDFSKKALVLDSDCRNNKFFGFYTVGPLEDVITDNGTGNYIEGWNIAGTPSFQSHGKLLQGRIAPPSVPTFAASDFTPDVSGGNVFKTNATVINMSGLDYGGGTPDEGHRVTILLESATDFAHDDPVAYPFFLQGEVDWSTGVAGESIEFMFDGTYWLEIDRRLLVLDGYRQTIDGWNLTDPGASASNLRLRRFSPSVSSAFDVWRTVRAGSITGILIETTAARTAGSLTVSIIKNGASTGITAVIDGTNTQQYIATFAKDTHTFAAGDEFYMRVSTTADWAPITADVWGAFEVET